jgi:hypothetical protein
MKDVETKPPFYQKIYEYNEKRVEWFLYYLSRVWKVRLTQYKFIIRPSQNKGERTLAVDIKENCLRTQNQNKWVPGLSYPVELDPFVFLS